MTSTTATPDPRSEPTQAAHSAVWVFLFIPLLFITIRAVFAIFNELSADEAYYWVWSRNLAFGYLDHPPMIAWLTAASCALFGDSELAVRLPAILLTGATILLATYAGHLLGLSRKSLLILQVVLFCFPMLHVMGTISTPDTPAMFFVMLSLTAALLCLRYPERWSCWLLLGIAAGLSMQSKYTALLPIAATLLFLLLGDRRHWYRPVLAGMVALVVISPLLYWNYQRNWLSFVFQFSHGVSPDDRPWYLNVGDFFGGQLIVATPLLAPLFIWAGLRSFRASPGHRLLAFASLLTLAFFALTSFRHKVEANWPTLAWVPLVVLLASLAPAIAASPRLLRYSKASLALAAIFVFALALPPSLLSRINKHSPLDKVGGWDLLASNIDHATGGIPTICLNYQDASLLSFYNPGQRSARALRFKGARRSQYDQLPLPNLANGFVLVARRNFQPGEVFGLYQGSRAFEVQVVSIQRCSAKVDDLTLRVRYAAICRLTGRDATTPAAYTTPTP